MSIRKLLAVKPHKQSTGLCGPSSLRIALSYFDLEYSEQYLARLSHATTKHGTEHTGMIRAIERLGGSVIAKDNGSIAEIEELVLRKKLPVIVGWFDRDDDHYSVIIGFTPTHLVMVDPSGGRTKKIPKSSFPAIWFDFVGPKSKIVSWRWYMAIDFPNLAAPRR
jgi:predicted double-glycine peptidase